MDLMLFTWTCALLGRRFALKADKRKQRASNAAGLRRPPRAAPVNDQHPHTSPKRSGPKQRGCWEAPPPAASKSLMPPCPGPGVSPWRGAGSAIDNADAGQVHLITWIYAHPAGFLKGRSPLCCSWDWWGPLARTARFKRRWGPPCLPGGGASGTAELGALESGAGISPCDCGRPPPPRPDSVLIIQDGGGGGNQESSAPGCPCQKLQGGRDKAPVSPREASSWAQPPHHPSRRNNNICLVTV